MAYRCNTSPHQNRQCMNPNTNNQNIRFRKNVFGSMFFLEMLSSIKPNPYPKRIENRFMNFHSRKITLNPDKKRSGQVEMALSKGSGVCCSTYEEKFASNTPTSAKPRIISTRCSRLRCPVGNATFIRFRHYQYRGYRHTSCSMQQIILMIASALCLLLDGIQRALVCALTGRSVIKAPAVGSCGSIEAGIPRTVPSRMN